MIKEFESVARKLQADFDVTAAQPHQGVKGQARERAVIREFLRPYLPKRFSIGTGLIVDSVGHVSKQQDVVVFDELNFPVLQDHDETKLFFSEQVLVSIEVKSTLDHNAIQDMVEKSMSLASLQRRSSGTVQITPGFVLDAASVPVTTLGFAYASTLSLEGIGDRLESLIVKQGAFRGPSAVLVLSDKTKQPGLVAGVDRRDLTRLTVVPEPTTVLAEIRTNNLGEALLHFYLALMNRVEREGLIAPGPDYTAYAKTAGLTASLIGLSRQSIQGARFLWEGDPVEFDDVSRLRDLVMKLNAAGDISDDEITEIFFRSAKLPKIDGGFRLGTVFVINDRPLNDLLPHSVGTALDHMSINQMSVEDMTVLSRFVKLIRSIRSSSDLLRIIDLRDGKQLFLWKGPNVPDDAA